MTKRTLCKLDTQFLVRYLCDQQMQVRGRRFIRDIGESKTGKPLSTVSGVVTPPCFYSDSDDVAPGFTMASIITTLSSFMTAIADTATITTAATVHNTIPSVTSVANNTRPSAAANNTANNIRPSTADHNTRPPADHNTRPSTADHNTRPSTAFADLLTRPSAAANNTANNTRPSTAAHNNIPFAAAVDHNTRPTADHNTRPSAADPNTRPSAAGSDVTLQPVRHMQGLPNTDVLSFMNAMSQQVANLQRCMETFSRKTDTINQRLAECIRDLSRIEGKVDAISTATINPPADRPITEAAEQHDVPEQFHIPMESLMEMRQMSGISQPSLRGGFFQSCSDQLH
ncbi:uncharacterized protein LOC110454171 [Mizuhopecten yessoensis]|uniref:uncharacterized protein LOC110454171 n=1 Tax=Mizuhopecten yessoensis TaxID=6573 RepID=UPI000B459819|nr:uncharacterized protein LOC110454171 [Mizuhopecten yessoensis]